MIPHPPRSALFPYTTLFPSAPRCASSGFPRPPKSLIACANWAFAKSNKSSSSAAVIISFASSATPGWPSVRSLQRRSEEHTSELQSQSNLVFRLLLEKTIPTNLFNQRPTVFAVEHDVFFLSRRPTPLDHHPHYLSRSLRRILHTRRNEKNFASLHQMI